MQTKAKNYDEQITKESFDAFLKLAIEKNLEVTQQEGVLNDTFIIENYKTIGIKGHKKYYDYIVLYPKFLNEWSNSFHILMTDDESDIEKFYD